MNILLRRTGALGDVMQSTPVARRLRERYPDAVIHVQTQHPAVYSGNPWVNAIGKRDMHYELVIDLDLAYEQDSHIHAVDAYMKRAFGSVCEERTLYLKSEAPPIELPEKYIVFHANVSWANRTLPRPWWGQLGKTLIAGGWEVFATGTQLDHDLAEWGVHDIRDQLTLAEQVGLLDGASCLVCGDSSIFGMVGATEIPAVGFCTITKPHLYIPYRHGEMGWNFTTMAAKVPCYGCREDAGPVTYLECQFGHNDCVRSFDIEEVYATVLAAIKNDRRHETV